MTHGVRALIALTLAVGVSLPSEKKLGIQRFAESDLIPVKTQVRFTTAIVLPDGEEISEVTCGDKEYWLVDGKDAVIHVKPAKEGATTNLNVVTKSKTIYSFLLSEITNPKGKGTKDRPDLKVIVSPEDLNQVKKKNEDLAKLLSDAEERLQAEKERAAAVQRELQKKKDKEEEEQQKKKKSEPERKAEAAPPPPFVSPAQVAPTQTHVVASTPAPSVKADFQVYATKRTGVLTRGAEVIGRVARKVGRFLRLF